MLINTRFIFLDYLRVFAFISVLIGHKMYPMIDALIAKYPAPHHTQQVLMGFLRSAFAGGGAGVIVFFMVSGYIILHVLRLESIKHFLIKRAFRIYPLFWFAMIVHALFVYGFNPSTVPWRMLFAQASLLGDFFEIPYALAGVEWTLRVEMLFYALMACLASLGIHRKPTILVLCFVIITLLLRYTAPFPTGLFSGYFSIYFPFLFLGSVLYLHEKKECHSWVLMAFSGFVLENYFQMIASVNPSMINLDFAFVGVLIFCLAHHFRAAFTQPLLNKAILWLSALTYPVYLFHNWLWNYMAAYGVTSPFLLVILLVIICYIVHRLIEQPINQYAKTLVKK